MQKFISLLKEIEPVLRQEKAGRGFAREGALIQMDPSPMVIIGDIHADAKALGSILSEAMIEDKFAEGWKLVFLGDYADRGPDPLEVYSSVFELKIAHPDNVFILKGNHEAADIFPFQPHDVPWHLSQLFPGSWRDIYLELARVQGLFATAAIVDAWLLLLHGGVFPGMTRRTLVSPTRDELKLILWSDPDEGQQKVSPSPRGAGIHFNYEVTREVLTTLNVKHIVRSHQVISGGYKFNHGGLVLTVISAKNVFELERGAFLSIMPFEPLAKGIKLF
jgi:hypothetical protein